MSNGAGQKRGEESLSERIAVLVLAAQDLTGIWSNDRYREIVIDPESIATGVTGRHITDFAPVMGRAKLPMMQRVAETGEPENGTDYLWDPGGRPRTYHWVCYRPAPDLLLVLIDCEPEAQPDR